MFAGGVQSRLKNRHGLNRNCESRRLSLLALEDRTVPTVITVMNVSSSGPGSLQQAILDANATLGADTIDFAPAVTGTIRLANIAGRTAITDELTITGPGASILTVSGQGLSFGSAIFGTTAPTTISGLSLKNGWAGYLIGSNYEGGAIASSASLTVRDCVFSDNGAGNSTSTMAPYGVGGAISHGGGSLLIERCSFSNNQTALAFNGFGGAGGAISASGAVVIRDSSFTGNSSYYYGGAIYLSSGSLTLEGSTFSKNTLDGHYGEGGAIFAGTLIARNCTFTGNFANSGGALFVGAGSTLLQNCTVTNNSGATSTFVGGYGGGGITGIVTVESTIVSGNTCVTGGPDIAGNVTARNSVIGNSSGFTLIDQGGNLAYGMDLKMGALANNGGLTQTVALLTGSPCINAGSNPAGLTTDQRGASFPRSIGKATDIGAFEVQGLPATITGIQINDGSAQRSVVTSITLTFDRTVTLPVNPADAFQLQHQPDNASIALNAVQNGPSVTLTFTGGPVNGASLTDGLYTLKALATMINGGIFDGNGDGTAGDDYISPTTPGDPNRVFRLFGDADGNGHVDGLDFAVFRTSFNTADITFDFDGNGLVDGLDFGQFRARFGMVI